MDARWKPLPPPPPVADDVAWRLRLWHALINLPLGLFVWLALGEAARYWEVDPQLARLRAAVPLAWIVGSVVVWAAGRIPPRGGAAWAPRAAAGAAGLAGTALPLALVMWSGRVVHVTNAHGSPQWSPALGLAFAAFAAAPPGAYLAGRDREDRRLPGPAVALAAGLLFAWGSAVTWVGSIYTGD
jgi:hypothetical protein